MFLSMYMYTYIYRERIRKQKDCLKYLPDGSNMPRALGSGGRAPYEDDAANSITSGSCPRGSKYSILGVSGPKNH